jgi:uncharacterized membrane protein YidH (DUF202 family)
MDNLDPNKQASSKTRMCFMIILLGLLTLFVGVLVFSPFASTMMIPDYGDAPWIAIAILVLLLLFGIVAVLVARKNPAEPDYRAFFYLGLIFTFIGIGSENVSLWPMGLCFLAIGMLNKDKWKKQKTWKEMNSGARLLLVLALGILVLIGVATFFVQSAAEQSRMY